MRKFLRILLIVSVILLVTLVGLVAIVIIKANTWSKEFQSEINPEYMASEASSLEEVLDQKTQQYILSEEDVEFITFTPREVAKIIYGSIQDMTGDGINVTNVYVRPNEDIWEVCGLTKFEKFRKFKTWFCAELTKDDMETAQLYVSGLNVQGISIDRIYPSVLTKINQGIAEALVTANENGFVGRIFENIELQKEQLVVKGTLY